MLDLLPGPGAGAAGASASASSSVDLPEPFLPTRNVTGDSNAIVGKVRIAGTAKGNSAPCSPGASEALRRWIMCSARTEGGRALRFGGARDLLRRHPVRPTGHTTKE